MTYWAETDVRKLGQVFQDRYSFGTLVRLIPVLQPQQSLAAKLRQFARDDIGQEGPREDLLIFCPHALHGYHITGPGLCEHLGAAAHDGYVAGFGDRGGDGGGWGSGNSQSFTRALIRILDTPDRATRGISVVDVTALTAPDTGPPGWQ
ncbi:hypothetical protein PGQ11_010230 [Apiospora arundinis]|uniref:Uncharacterized protein n=1 Tax=Apiospora arundinis TaxID=335852 RepID=A0ABR2I9L8_9PEZI